MVWIKKALFIVFVLLLSLVLIGCVKESIVPDLSKPNATSELSFQECKDEYSWYFEQNPNNEFVVNFQKPVSKIEIEDFLKNELHIKYELRYEFQTLYRYIILPENDNGLDFLCNISTSKFKSAISLNRGSGGIA